jgi:hypothetical protein
MATDSFILTLALSAQKIINALSCRLSMEQVFLVEGQRFRCGQWLCCCIMRDQRFGSPTLERRPDEYKTISEQTALILLQN